MIPARAPVAWLVAVAAGSLVSGFSGPPLAGQATAVLLEDCNSVDSVFATRVLRIAEEVPRMGTFALDGRGRLFGWAPQRAQGVVWDLEGARVGMLIGPVYHEGSTIPAAIVAGPGDTIHVFERTELTHARFSPGLEFLGSRPLPGQPHFNGVVRLPGGEWVMSAIVDTPDRVGWPLHLLDDEGGIVRSFGTSLPFHRADATRLGVRSVAVAGDDLVWTAHLTEYRLELWDTHNRLHKAFVRNLPWFPKWTRNKPISPEEPLNPELRSIRIDADGLLWVEVSRASEQFAEAVEWSDEWEMCYPASTSEYHETFFEVIDVEAGCIAARGTTGALLVNAVGDGFHAGYEDWVTDGALVEDLRLGAADDFEPELFSTIRSFALDAKGSIYVLDVGSREIRVFDSTGHFLRSQGGPGQGPGEFAVAAGLAWGPAGELWVADYNLYVYNVLAPDGTFLRSVPRAVRGSIYPWPGWFDPGGFLVDWTYGRERVAVEEFPARETRNLVRVSSDGEPLDTPLVLTHVVPLVAGGERWIPFRPATGMRPGPSGSLLWYLTDEYSIARVTQTLGRGAGSVVDIFTDTGVYLGAMEAPGISVGRGAPPPVVRGGYLYAVVRDELDVENLIRFRIERPDGP